MEQVLNSHQVTQETSGENLYSQIKTTSSFTIYVFLIKISAIEFSFSVSRFVTNWCFTFIGQCTHKFKISFAVDQQT